VRADAEGRVEGVEVMWTERCEVEVRLVEETAR